MMSARSRIFGAEKIAINPIYPLADRQNTPRIYNIVFDVSSCWYSEDRALTADTRTSVRMFNIEKPELEPSDVHAHILIVIVRSICVGYHSLAHNAYAR